MAIFLTTSLAEAEQNGHAKDMLDLLEAMWYQQALRERHFDAWITLLSQAHRREVVIVFVLSSSATFVCSFAHFVFHSYVGIRGFLDSVCNIRSRKSSRKVSVSAT